MTTGTILGTVDQSLLRLHRDTPVFKIDKCDICDYPLPDDSDENGWMLSRQSRYSAWSPLDDWFCPSCNAGYAQVWFLDELVWYDEFEFSKEDEEERTEFIERNHLLLNICCGMYGTGCQCAIPLNFDDALLLLSASQYSSDDFYHKSKNFGVDCRSCMFFSDEICTPFGDSLYKFYMTKEFSFELITPCQDYSYEKSKESSYDQKSFTADLVKAKYNLKKI